MFGLPTEDDGSRNDPLMANMRGQGVTRVPDLDAVRRAPTRVVIGVGEESGGPSDGEIAAQSAHAVAQGFLGGEHGQTGKPEEFAVRLREVLRYRPPTAATTPASAR